MAKKVKHPEHVNHERWLVSYADFITLLFAFFVVLYALSEVDKNKLKKFHQSVQFAFAHVGSGGTMTQGKNPATLKPKLVGGAWPQGRRDSDPGPFEALTAVVEYLENSMMRWFVREERPDVEVIQDGKGVVIRLPSERLFSPSSAQLRPDRTSFLDEFGRVVEQQRVSFHIHLDLSVPYGGDVSSQFDLGERRIAAIVRAVRGTSADARARIRGSIDLEEKDEVETSEAESSRSVFSLMILP